MSSTTRPSTSGETPTSSRSATSRTRWRGSLGAPVTFAEGAGPDVRDYRVDFSKITAELPAFQPRWTVPLGIDQLYADMTRLGLTAEDFENRYIRLAQISRLMREGRMDDNLRVSLEEAVR